MTQNKLLQYFQARMQICKLQISAQVINILLFAKIIWYFRRCLLPHKLDSSRLTPDSLHTVFQPAAGASLLSDVKMCCSHFNSLLWIKSNIKNILIQEEVFHWEQKQHVGTSRYWNDQIMFWIFVLFQTPAVFCNFWVSATFWPIMLAFCLTTRDKSVYCLGAAAFISRRHVERPRSVVQCKTNLKFCLIINFENV